MNRNNTSFPIKSTILLKKYLNDFNNKNKKDKKDKFALKYYQHLIKESMLNPEFGIGTSVSGTRGLLIYHVMGAGKTILAVSIALEMMKTHKPIILSARGLRKNFEETIKQLDGENNKFKFVSLDAYNVIDQLERANFIKGALEGKLLIVDEAHNLFRGIINSGNDETNARQIYNIIMNTRNIKLLFLTGTPSIKHPFELVPCFNMLAGKEILPSKYNIFTKHFINQSTNTIINTGKLANRLLGMVSCVETKEIEGFPDDLGTEIKYIEMTKEQYTQYLVARDLERKEGHGSKYIYKNDFHESKELALPSAERKGFTTYYSQSRQIENYGGSMIDSPKMIEAVKFANSKGIILIYSEFVHKYGLEKLSEFLEKDGFEPFNAKNPQMTQRRRYAIIRGEVSQEDRAVIQQTINLPNNAHGEIIKVLLISKTGAEGLDLKNIRIVVLLEPYWDKSRETQVKSRAIRLNSHILLPKDEQNVQTYLLISTKNMEIYSSIPKDAVREEKTVDEMFQERSIRRQVLNDNMREFLKYISLECQLQLNDKCRICAPTNAALFTDDFVMDMKIPDPCNKVEEYDTSIDGSVILDNEEYSYKLSTNLTIFYKFDKKLDGWVQIKNNALIKKLKELVI